MLYRLSTWETSQDLHEDGGWGGGGEIKKMVCRDGQSQGLQDVRLFLSSSSANKMTEIP